MIFVLWIFFSFVAAIIASNKGRSGAACFFISLVLSPLIGILVALLTAENAEELEKIKLASGANKKCPSCCELIKIDARICRYCNRDC